jgi:hypothetical protein
MASLVLATTLLFACGGTGHAAAGNDDPNSLSVIGAGSTDVASILECRNEPAISVRTTANALGAEAFTLSPAADWQPGQVLTAVPAGEATGASTDINALIAIVKDFYNRGNRLEPREYEACAWQLAIWHFNTGLDLQAMQGNIIVARALVLIDAYSDAPPQDRDTPVSQPRIRLTKVGEYPSGESFTAHLYEPQQGNNAPVPGALIRFGSESSGAPLRMMLTNKHGDATIDLGNRQATPGGLQAQWLGSLPPGTFISNGSSYAILFESVRLSAQSNSVPHAAPNLLDLTIRTQNQAAALLGGLPPFLLIGFEILLLFGVFSFVRQKAESLKGRKAAGATLAALVLVFTVIYILSQKQSQAFQPEWAEVSLPTEQTSFAVAKVAWVGATSEFNGEHDNAFAGTCAVDGSTDSSWLSLRNLGSGEILALGLKRPMLVTELRVTPGWFSTPDLYDQTASPQRIQVFGDSGLIAEEEIDESQFTQNPKAIKFGWEDMPLPASVLYIRILRIHGDTRSYAAISELVIKGYFDAETDPREEIIDVNEIRPRVLASEDCYSS